MSENVAPNRLPKKLIQTKIICGLNKEITLDFKSVKTRPAANMSSSAKRLRSADKVIDKCNDCALNTQDMPKEPIPEVDPRLVDDNSDDSIEVIDSEAIEESNANNEYSLTLEMELNLIDDCTDNNPTVKALKTVDEIKSDCLAMGLVLDTEVDNEDSEEESDCASGAVNFEVESIYDTGVDPNTKRITYSVKWKNWSEDYNTWEPLSNLKKCRQLVDEFKHILTLNDKKLMTVYRNYYKLKGVIEDICEKKVSFDVMTAILLIFYDISLKHFTYTKVYVNKMRMNLKSIYLTKIDEISAIHSIDKRVKRMQTYFNEMLEKLNILKRFQSFEKFFEFFTKRKAVEHRLQKWENEVNAIIKKEGEGLAVIVENLVDYEVPPHNFEYISQCKTNNPNITISDDPPVYCECTDCESQQSECCVSSYGLPIVYTKNAILKDSRNNRNAIYECNTKCKCDRNCINRVVQNGRKHKLAIFRTEDGKGWGVRALEPIAKGSFVMEYVGEIITVDEADKRGRVYDAEGRTYLFDLDYTPDEETDSHQYALDATQCGNISHFVNHSCDPNLDTLVVWINNLDPFMPHIALFAVRGIRLNEELTFDYRINVHGITDANESPELNDSALILDKSFDSGIDGSTSEKMETNRKVAQMRVECRCGANNCKKYLY